MAAITVICFAAIIAISQVPSLRVLTVSISAILVGLFVQQIVKWVKPVEIEVFRDHRGEYLFEISKERGSEAAFEGFVADLRAAIAKARKRSES